MTGLGSLAWFRGDHALATTHKEAALSLYQELGEEVAIAPPLISDTLNDLGSITYAAGDAALAQARFEEALLRQRALDFTWGAVPAEAARAAGRALTTEDAVAEALALVAELQHGTSALARHPPRLIEQPPSES